VLCGHTLHLSPPGTPTLGLFTRPAEGALRRCPTLLLPGHTVEEQRARRFFLEGVSGFPLGYHIGSARTEVVRFFRCGGLAPLLAPARPRHVRVRMVSRFSAQAAKGRVQKYPSWEPVPVPSGAVGFSSRRLHLQNTQINSPLKNTMAANASFFQLCVARSGAGTR